MKHFVLGLALGLVILLIVWGLSPSKNDPMTVESNQDLTAGTLPGPTDAGPNQPAKTEAQSAQTIPEPQPNESVSNNDSAQLDSSNSVSADEIPPAPHVTDPAIPMPEDFSQFLSQSATDDKTVGDLHRQLEQEERESSMAPFLEEQMRDFLLRQPGIEGYELLLIACRTASCEIQARGFGETAAGPWVSMMGFMREEPWFQFTGSSTSAQSRDDQTILLTIFHSEGQDEPRKELQAARNPEFQR